MAHHIRGPASLSRLCRITSSSSSGTDSNRGRRMGRRPTLPTAGGALFSSSSSSSSSDWKDADKVLRYARESPLFPKCFPTTNQQQHPLPSGKEWVEKGDFMRHQLNVEPSTPLQSDSGIRIFHLYLPLYFWLRWLVMRARKQPLHPRSCTTTVIGINAPQGAGKTTLVNFCQAMFKLDGLSSVVLSIDDFYLTNKEQQALANKHPDNRLLQYRGNAGTHDVALGRETILKCLKAQEGESIAIPSYDKSLCGGRGDRAPPELWPQVEGPIDVVLLEGWMLGFRPLPADDPSFKKELDREPGLAEVNNYLPDYHAWHELIDAWVVVQVEDVEMIHSWRLEAEQQMRKEKGTEGSMSDDQVTDFVSRFLPSYKAFLVPSLYAPETFREAQEEVVLRFMIDKQRKPRKE